VLLYAGSATARFMNSSQTGAAEDPPARPKSRLSSNPTHTTHNKLDVYPANQPSLDVLFSRRGYRETHRANGRSGTPV